MKALLVIMILWPSGHRDIVARINMVSMDVCMDSLNEAVRVWTHDYEGDLFEEHSDEGDSFVIVAYCAQRVVKSDPAL